MKFTVEKTKDNQYRVVNDTTGMVRGIHKTKGEADQQASMLQKQHNQGMKMASATLAKKPEDKKEKKEEADDSMDNTDD